LRRAAPEVREGRAFVGDVAVSDLAERYGTPLYALDAAIIDASVERMRSAFRHPRVAIYYSCKANPSVVLLRRLREKGVGLDACSPGDLTFAAAACLLPAEVSYTGHSMTDAELAQVARSSVSFTADSLSQVERMGDMAPGRAIGLRLNCGIDAGFHPHVQAGALLSKFGIHLAQLDDAVALAHDKGLRVVGMHSHLGSDITSPRPHLELLDALLRASDALPDLEWVNLGGGFGDLDDELYDFESLGEQAGARLRNAEARVGRPLELRLEPGGYFVLNAGCLVTRVTELKPAVTLDDFTSPSFVGVDTSHNHLVSSVIYGAEHPVWVAERADAQPDDTYDVVGNLMQAGDVIARGRPLPQPLPGDVLVIGRCGGYAAWRAPAFNERPRPVELIVDGTSVTIARRGETTADLLQGEAL
jgi:diaminopimelate decarboxylase